MTTKNALALTAAFGLLSLTGIATAKGTVTDDQVDPMTIAAEIELEGGKILFVDETIDGRFGLGVLEVGRVNLAPLYELGATPLEMFLAIAPEGAEPPAILFEAHERARATDPGVPAEPRDFTRLERGTFLKANLPYHTFAVETAHCKDWGNVSSFDPVLGNSSYTHNNAYQEFIDWSMIAGGLLTSSSAYFEEDAEWNDQEYATPFGNHRALAMCVTHAIKDHSESYGDCQATNTVNYRVRLLGTDGTSTWGSGWEFLTTYGEGVRYRSSSSGDRKYTLQVHDLSVGSIICKERYDVYTRSLNTFVVSTL